MDGYVAHKADLLRAFCTPTEHHTCCACGEAIADRFLLEVGGGTWHTGCLRCCVCAVQLDRHPSCFLRDRQVYCKQDYVKGDMVHLHKTWRSHLREDGVGATSRESLQIPDSDIDSNFILQQ
ncbi:LIM/homeobox protein Awh [Papilio xuthus]|uniref:LIM/homeobox protein Awh n=1 Tax=Papilio xuthus TaxID=66420 RepID=A0A194PT55_PAPXU|nr:LIM/homeobox protein Awh [Papilio xuthus]